MADVWGNLFAGFGDAVSQFAQLSQANGHDKEAGMFTDDMPKRRSRPRVRVVTARANVDDDLITLYDPERDMRQFYKPAKDYAHLGFAPVRSGGQWIDPPAPHRLQLVESYFDIKTRRRVQRCREARPATGKALKELSETPEYRAARFYEATGSWCPNVSRDDYKRYVESANPWTEQAEAERKQLREAAFQEHDAFATGDDMNSGASVMRDIDTEYIPIQGGPYHQQLYLYAHWEAQAKCFYEKNHSELAKAAISITSDFVIGKGIAWKIKSPRVAAVWEEFWVRNNMETRIRTWSDDLCLDGSTRIACLDGTNPTIAELADRDISVESPLWVYSYDHTTGRVAPGKAVRCWKQPKQKRCVSVLLDNGEEVIASFDHPFLARNGEYVDAEQLQAGDSLMPLYRKIKNDLYEKVWHPDARGQRWQVTHHMAAGIGADDLIGTGLCVHHKNENKRDNRPENLDTMARTAHMGMHILERWQDPEHRMRMESAFRQTRSTPEGRERQRRNAEKLWECPDKKAAVIETIRRTYQTEEVQARHSEAVSRTWDDPQVRQRRIEGMRAASARRKSNARARVDGNNHKVVEVRDAGYRWVYDLSVEGFHNFALHAGVFTHNTWQGELLIHKERTLSGFLKVRSLNPSTVLEIVTVPQDIDSVILYHCQYPTAYIQPYTQFRGHNLDIPLQKFVIEQYAASEVYHTKLNVTAHEKRGRSDYFSSLTTLKRHRDWLNGTILKEILQANFVYDLTLTGTDEDVDAFMSDSQNVQQPPPGSTWVHNSAVTMTPMHADVSRMQRGASPGDFLTALFACAVQMPVTYFNVGNNGPARATALVQGEPFVRKVASRQQIFRDLLDHLYEATMREAVRAGRLRPDEIRSESADPEWIFASTYEEDRGAFFRDLVTAKGMGTISHRTMSTQMAKDLQLTEYSYDTEQAEIAKERLNPFLKLWPPHTPEATMAVEPGMQPGAPVPQVGEWTPKQPAPGQQGFQPQQAQQAQDGEPQGRNERIAGADERHQFRNEQREHPTESDAVTPTDRRFLESAIAAGVTGEVRLPSGLVAKVD